MKRSVGAVVCAILTVGLYARGSQAAGPTGLAKVNHVIIAMQENHSYDSYFGVLALAQGSPYHSPAPGHLTCAGDPHPTTCVERLSCSVHPDGTYTCANSNPDDSGPPVASF